MKQNNGQIGSTDSEHNDPSFHLISSKKGDKNCIFNTIIYADADDTTDNSEKYISQSIPVIGITGGVGSGKSVVMDVLRERFNAAIILADNVGHDLMKKGAANYDALISHFGRGILDQDGEILRPALSKMVFSDEKNLALINDITHPNIKNEIIRRIEAYQNTGKFSLIAVEAALLIEEKYAEFLDEIWYVHVDKEERIKRLQTGRGYTREKSLCVINTQLSDEAFIAASDRVIDNNGSINDIERQIIILLGGQL